MTIVYIGLGSNVGERKLAMKNAVAELSRMQGFRMTSVSSLYETAAIGVAEQADFYNAVVEAETDFDPAELLERLNQIEQHLGRDRKVKWGPRTLDLDILLFGRQVVMNERLSVPHPEMVRRKFVLLPLAEINPDALHPIVGKTIGEIYATAGEDVREQKVEKIEGMGWHV